MENETKLTEAQFYRFSMLVLKRELIRKTYDIETIEVNIELAKLCQEIGIEPTANYQLDEKKLAAIKNV